MIVLLICFLLLYVIIILQKPDCIGFSISKSSRQCRLSDYAEGWTLTNDDAYDTYKKISDESLESPVGAAGANNPAPHSHSDAITVESRKTTKTDPISTLYTHIKTTR